MSLRQAQRPYGHHFGTGPYVDEPATRITVAAALSPHDAAGAGVAPPRSLSLSKGRNQHTSCRFDKLSDRMGTTSGQVRMSMSRPPASPSLLLLVRTTRRARVSRPHGP